MAVIEVFPLDETVQGVVPGQATPVPLHPAKLEPLAGIAVSVTDVPPGNEAEHVGSHVIPVELDVTVPLPEPALMIVSVGLGGRRVNVAVADASAVSVTVQVVPDCPAQTPLHVENVWLILGEAMTVTTVPVGAVRLHVIPQLMPSGDVEVTVPAPAVVIVSTASVDCGSPAGG